MKISYYNPFESDNFNPQEYVGFIKDSKEQGVTSLVWEKLFNTTESLAEIASSVTIDMEFNRRDEGSNRVMMFRYDPDDNHRKLRKDIFKILKEKWNILRSSGLTEREVFEVFKFSKFKYLNAIPDLVRKKDLRLQIKHEIEVIEDMKKEPQILTDENVTLVDEPILSEYTSTESISTKNEPDFSKAGEFPTMQTLEQEKLKQAGQFPILEETSSENVKADVEEQTGFFRAFVRRIFTSPKPVSEEPVNPSRRKFIKGALASAALASAGVSLLSDSDHTESPEPIPEPIPEPNPEPNPEPTPELESDETLNDNIDQAPEVLNRDQLKEHLRQLTVRYSELPNKQTFGLLAESESNPMFLEAIGIIKHINLSAQELIDLKLIRESNLRKFKDDRTRLDAIFKEKMSASDNWIISTMINMYRANPDQMAERFMDGALYEAMESVSRELKEQTIEGYSDTLDELEFLKETLFSSEFIEAVLMIEGGLRGIHFSNTAKTEITRSMINSGQFNPNFGSIVGENLRIGINHILTYYFIRGGADAPGAVINNQYARNYFSNHGILRKDGYDYRLKKCKAFNAANRANPQLNAPTETKIAEILTDPEESIRIMLMSYRENLHYMKDALVDNLDRLNQYAEIIDNFWIKIIALTNICGGPLTRKLILELGKLPATRENYLRVLNKRNSKNEKIYHPDYAEKVDSILTSIQDNPAIEPMINLKEAQALSNPLHNDNL